MRNRLLLVLGTLAFGATAILLQPRQISGMQGQTSGATIRGTITRAGTAEPIPDVNVFVTNGRAGARGTVQSLEETVARAIANGIAIPTNIQAELVAERARVAAGTNVQLTTTSDRDGRFSAGNLPPGQYTVQVEREGFFGLPLNPGGNYAVSLNRSVEVTAGQTPPDLAVFLVPGSAVSGRVVDPAGRPVVGSGVQAFQVIYQNGTPILQSAAAADTDDRGDYRLFRIPPGDYYFGVTPGQSSGRGGFGGRAGRGAIPASGETLVKTFYPDATDSNSARLFALRGGEELTGIAINARRSPTIKVSGQVSSAIALPVRTGPRGQTQTVPVQLSLVPRSRNTAEDPNNRNTVSVSMDSPADGKFEIPGVIPGSYDLFARVNVPITDPAALNTSTEPLNYFGRTSFEAGYQDVSGLAVLVRSGVEVKAYVTVDGSAAAANTVRVTLQPDDSARSMGTVYTGGRGAQALPGPDGMVNFPFVNEGLFRFQVAIAAGAPARGLRGANVPALRAAYVEDIREGGQSVYDTGLVVGKEAPRLIEVLVKTNGGTVQGTVYDAELQPKAGATVALVPVEPRRQNVALYKFATSGDRGQFGMIAVPPGQYKVFAWESIPSGAHQNAAFISKYEARGASVTVNASSTTNTQVTVIPANK